MKKRLDFRFPALILMFMSSDHLFAQEIVDMRLPQMNLYTLELKDGAEEQFKHSAQKNIQASVENEHGTIAMYSFAEKMAPLHTYTVEIYKDPTAYQAHLKSQAYREFLENASELLANKNQIELKPQFLADKKVTQTADIRNNFVIVDVKPKYQDAFKEIVSAEMAQSLKVEDGVLAMYAATSVEKPNRWYFYEIYANDAAYQLHRTTAHFKYYIDHTAKMTTNKISVDIVPLVIKNKGSFHFLNHK